MDYLKPEDLLKPRLAHETVEVPEWGTKVEVWELPANVEQDFEDSAQGLKPSQVMAKLVSLCAGTLDGRFDPPLDEAQLLNQSPTGLLRVFGVAKRVNKMTKESAEAVLKNS